MPLEFRLRDCCFRFRAIDSIFFPPFKAGNVLRGALAPVVPSTNPVRPFVLRAAHLDGKQFASGDVFSFSANVFDVNGPVYADLESACAEWRTRGLGPRRGRVELLSAEDEIVTVNLNPGIPASECALRFATPASLKGNASRDDIPFAILFARLRERIIALCTLYGNVPPETDFGVLTTRAAEVQTVRRDLRYQAVERRSSRTGAVHGIGGLVGTAEYAGDLTDFLPWLRVGRWTGVGRHTVWGNGVVEVLHVR